MINKKTAKHYHWGANCEAWALLDTPNLSVKLELMPPGSREDLHFHKTALQFFYVLAGTATFIVNNERVEIKAAEGIPIQPGSHHFISNETDSDLEFLVISQPSTENDRILPANTHFN